MRRRENNRNVVEEEEGNDKIVGKEGIQEMRRDNNKIVK